MQRTRIDRLHNCLYAYLRTEKTYVASPLADPRPHPRRSNRRTRRPSSAEAHNRLHGAGTSLPTLVPRMLRRRPSLVALRASRTGGPLAL